MINKSLGEVLRELRDKVDLSLRELAGKAEISAPFLSDIELGKRYPSDDVLKKLANILKTPFDDLKQYDNRNTYADIKRMMENPQIGFAFRSVAEKYKKGELSVAELINNIQTQKKEK